MMRSYLFSQDFSLEQKSSMLSISPNLVIERQSMLDPFSGLAYSAKGKYSCFLDDPVASSSLLWYYANIPSIACLYLH